MIFEVFEQIYTCDNSLAFSDAKRHAAGSSRKVGLGLGITAVGLSYILKSAYQYFVLPVLGVLRRENASWNSCYFTGRLGFPS